MVDAAQKHREHRKALEMAGTCLTAIRNISLNMNHISNKRGLCACTGGNSKFNEKPLVPEKHTKISTLEKQNTCV